MCNGWTNRETWLVNLWFGDSFAMQQDDGAEITANYIRETVESYVDENLGAARHGFIGDMLDLGAINYAELANHYAPEAGDAE